MVVIWYWKSLGCRYKVAQLSVDWKQSGLQGFQGYYSSTRSNEVCNKSQVTLTDKKITAGRNAFGYRGWVHTRVQANHCANLGKTVSSHSSRTKLLLGKVVTRSPIAVSIREEKGRVSISSSRVNI